MIAVLKKGLTSGCKTSLALAKIVFPITFIVLVLQYTPLMGFLEGILSPFMHHLGLPGEAALPIVLAGVLNLYAGIGAVVTMTLTVKQTLILAVMMSFAHNLLVETSVAKKVGLKFWPVLLYRVFLAITGALLIHLFWKGGEDVATFGVLQFTSHEVSGWNEIILNAAKGGVSTVIQLSMYVIPIIMFITIMKERGWLHYLQKIFKPVTKLFGLQPNVSLMFASGLLFGLAYGAGVMIASAKEEEIRTRDLWVVFLFLSSCHAIVEDTLLFIPLGIPILALFFLRFFVAMITTYLVASWFKVVDRNKRVRGELDENYNSTI